MAFESPGNCVSTVLLLHKLKLVCQIYFTVNFAVMQWWNLTKI